MENLSDQVKLEKYVDLIDEGSTAVESEMASLFRLADLSSPTWLKRYVVDHMEKIFVKFIMSSAKKSFGQVFVMSFSTQLLMLSHHY